MKLFSKDLKQYNHEFLFLMVVVRAATGSWFAGGDLIMLSRIKLKNNFWLTKIINMYDEVVSK